MYEIITTVGCSLAVGLLLMYVNFKVSAICTYVRRTDRRIKRVEKATNDNAAAINRIISGHFAGIKHVGTIKSEQDEEVVDLVEQILNYVSPEVLDKLFGNATTTSAKAKKLREFSEGRGQAAKMLNMGKGLAGQIAVSMGVVHPEEISLARDAQKALARVYATIDRGEEVEVGTIFNRCGVTYERVMKILEGRGLTVENGQVINTQGTGPTGPGGIPSSNLSSPR